MDCPPRGEVIWRVSCLSGFFLCRIAAFYLLGWLDELPPDLYEELVSKARCRMSAKIDHDIKPRELELTIISKYTRWESSQIVYIIWYRRSSSDGLTINLRWAKLILVSAHEWPLSPLICLLEVWWQIIRIYINNLCCAWMQLHRLPELAVLQAQVVRTYYTVMPRLRPKSTSFSGDNLEISKRKGHTQLQTYNQFSLMPDEYMVMFV